MCLLNKDVEDIDVENESEETFQKLRRRTINDPQAAVWKVQPRHFFRQPPPRCQTIEHRTIFPDRFRVKVTNQIQTIRN